MQIVTIAEATARRLTRYFTGIPCRHGHISERRVSDRGCCECGRLRSRIENMTPAQIEKERSRVRLPVEDMTPDQLRRYEAANRRRLTNQLRAKFRKLWG